MPETNKTAPETEGMAVDDNNKTKPEGAKAIDFNEAKTAKEKHEKAREKAKQRQKPTKETLDRQTSGIAETMEGSINDEKQDLEKILLEEGNEVTPQDFKELHDTVPEFFSETNPQLRDYIKNLTPRLDQVIDETAKLKENKLDAEALGKFGGFLKNEAIEAEKIQDPKLREIIKSHISLVLDADKLQKDIEAQKRLNHMSEGADCIPAFGTVKMAYETAKGRTAAGEELHGVGRAIHGGCAAVSLVSDVFTAATVVETFGAGAAVSEAAKMAAMAVGKKMAKEAVVGGVKTVAKNQLGSISDTTETVEKFAALCHKSEHLKKASVTMYKIGHMMQEHPQIAKAVTDFSKLRAQSDTSAESHRPYARAA